MHIAHVSRFALAGVATLSISACAPAGPPPSAITAATLGPVASTPALHADPLVRGEYLVRMTGCNDCHTAGYAPAQGEIPVAQWLQGSPLGYRGPWGTTYAANLRLLLAGMDEAQWMAYSATLRTRPIMPDFVLRQMHADDRRAIYLFIRSLGPAGEPAPAFLPPSVAPPLPYMQLFAAEPPRT